MMFNASLAKNHQAPEEEGLKGKVYVTSQLKKMVLIRY
jgi:hypothetical protein